MAITALDHPKTEDGTETQPARHYYRGWEHIGVNQFGAGKDDPAWPAVRQRIARAIRTLEELGAIRTVHPASNGMKAVYELLPVD